MELFIADSFTDQIFMGNQAGVVLLREEDGFPEPAVMQKIAAELKHSETAFVQKASQRTFLLRFYTPDGEVALCGHATIAAFTVLRDEKKLNLGDYVASTLKGDLAVTVESGLIWLEMARGKLLKQFDSDESLELYRAYGLTLEDMPDFMKPCIVDTGLPDILLPVISKERLNRAIQNREMVIDITKRNRAVGVHMFYLENSPEVTAYCRNFAPLYGIDEEAATGTSNGALAHSLLAMNLIQKTDEHMFIQGESMGKPSVIKSRVSKSGAIFIGGNAVISVSGRIRL